jgi:predicted dehydrogenase
LNRSLAVGLIGCGAVVHNNYASVLIGREEEYQVRYVTDLDAAQAESAAELFGAEPVDLDRLLTEADAVVISTPPASHAQLVRAALRDGRTILCEKPFTTSYGDAVEASKAAANAGARLYVGHFRRAFPQLALARELISLGLVGEVRAISATEGGRFTWRAVSNYTLEDPTGGVLWDTGTHTLDMALHAAGLDRADHLEVEVHEVTRDRPEPSHDFRGRFDVSANGRSIEGMLHVSRKDALPNIVRITGEAGEVSFITGLDDRVRVSTSRGTTVLRADRTHVDILEPFDIQVRSVLLGRDAEVYEAGRFVGQIKLIEALSNA